MLLELCAWAVCAWAVFCAVRAYPIVFYDLTMILALVAADTNFKVSWIYAHNRFSFIELGHAWLGLLGLLGSFAHRLAELRFVEPAL